MKKIMQASMVLVLAVILSTMVFATANNPCGAPTLTAISPANNFESANGSVTFEVQGNANITSVSLTLPVGVGTYTMTARNVTNYKVVVSNIPEKFGYSWTATATPINSSILNCSMGFAGNFSSVAAVSSTSRTLGVSIDDATTAKAAAAAIAIGQMDNAPQTQAAAGSVNLGGFSVPIWALVLGAIAAVLLFKRK